MVLLDAVGRWDADTDIDMHNIAAYNQHLGRLCELLRIFSHLWTVFSSPHYLYSLSSVLSLAINKIILHFIFMILAHPQLQSFAFATSYFYDS